MDTTPRIFTSLKLNFPIMRSRAEASAIGGFVPCLSKRISWDRNRLVLSASAITILPFAMTRFHSCKSWSAVVWKRIVPSVSSAKVMNSLSTLKTVPVNSKSMGCVMFSNGMAFALLTDVRTVPMAGKDAISASKMYKTAFMYFD